MYIDLNLLKCFAAVSLKGSISQASLQLNLSQPAVSLQIKRLEEQLGRKLFDRHNRGLVLSKFGVKFLEKARQLLELENQLISLVEDNEKEAKGSLRVGTYTTASSYLIANSAANFLAKNQLVTLIYDYSDSRTLLEKVKGLQIDCAVLSDVPADPHLNVEKFFEDELVYAIAPNRKASLPKSIPASELTSFPLLSYPLRYDLCYRRVEAKLGSHLNKCRVSLETESFDTLKQMLLKGAGGTFIPRYLIAKELALGNLVNIQIGSLRFPIEFSLVTKRGTPQSLALRNFRNSLLNLSN